MTHDQRIAKIRELLTFNTHTAWRREAVAFLLSRLDAANGEVNRLRDSFADTERSCYERANRSQNMDEATASLFCIGRAINEFLATDLHKQEQA